MSDTTKPAKTRFVDSGWRVTIPKAIRLQLDWDTGTRLCVSWDGSHIVLRGPATCVLCPDVVRMGALGKVVIPQKVRQEARLYRGQILSLSVKEDQVVAWPHALQVRCQCGSEYDVRDVLPNVHLCKRCRLILEETARRWVGGDAGALNFPQKGRSLE